MTNDRYCAAFALIVGSSSWMYSFSDCTMCSRDVCFDSSSAGRLDGSIWTKLEHEAYFLRFDGQSLQHQSCHCQW